MARKISGNPQVAFMEGRNQGYKEAGYEALNYARHFAVLALYNIVQNFLPSEKKQRELLKAYCEEQERIYAKEFYGEPDNVLLAVEGVKKIYREIGYELSDI